MRFLIDTECWLWWFLEPDRLNQEAKRLIADKSNIVYLSAASAWEVAIKAALGKLILPETPDQYVPKRLAALDMLPLSIEHAHALRVFALPSHHRDPFDRILIAQAQLESLPILTADRILALYDVQIIWGSARRSLHPSESLSSEAPQTEGLANPSNTDTTTSDE